MRDLNCAWLNSDKSIFRKEYKSKRWIEKLDKEAVKKLKELLEYISKIYGGINPDATKKGEE